MKSFRRWLIDGIKALRDVPNNPPFRIFGEMMAGTIMIAVGISLATVSWPSLVIVPYGVMVFLHGVYLLQAGHH